MASQRNFIAWQVGRVGDVAGGMTQVVNAFCSWPFEQFRVDVIVSRDGGFSFKSIKIFFKAIFRVLALRNPASEMLVVHLSQGGSFLREGAIALLAKARGFGVVAHLHGSSFVRFAKKNKRLVRLVLGHIDAVVTLSEATKNMTTEILGDNRKVVLIPNAVPGDVEEAKENLVVFGGAVSTRKGVDVLVRAWSKLEIKENWVLMIAGPVVEDGVLPPELEKAVFLGAISHDQLMGLLRKSSIAVLPSRDEAMPMFILEAMARKNCVISTSVGGIPSVLGEGKGIVLPPGDVDALADALGKAMVDEKFRTAIAQSGWHDYLNRFSATAVYPRIESLWASALRK